VSLELVIVTPAGEVYHGPVASVVLPGSEGDFGVLPGHERFLAPLRIGEISIKAEDGKAMYGAISGGFVEISADRVVVMADSAELATDIDVARAERAKASAEAELERARREQADVKSYKVQEAALARALIRIQVAQKTHEI
jgi:F-type H+-transporting ATPase subunit epsilon